MKRYLFDTTLIIDTLRNKTKAVSFLNSFSEVPISVITAGESYQGARDKKDLLKIEDFITSHCRIIALNENISTVSLRLIKTYTLSSGLLIADALIAATAITENLILLTGNMKHFQKIKSLKVESWSS